MKVAGFGYRREAGLSSLAELLDRVSLTFGHIDALAALADKSELVTSLGCERNLPVLIIRNDRISGSDTLTQSPHSQRTRGTGSVAEALAMEGAGEGACLMAPREISEDRMATCAVASGENP